MNDYIVTIQVTLEISAETEALALSRGLETVKSALHPEEHPEYQTIHTSGLPFCTGGDDDLATELCKEIGTSYRVIKTWLDRQPDRDEASNEELVERFGLEDFF